ncbi:MAG: CRISPR-associated endonuclease Cas1 [Nitrospirae bacterium]|nr:CRISPR-associated endonuclease Cas1 [Nitrospirota bacterium]
MGTLYIDRKELHVRLDGDALAFYANGGRDGIVPINPLKRVIMVGNITIETSVLNRLATDNISVLFLSGKRNRFCGMLHGKLHNNGLLRLKQYEKSLSSFPMDAAFNIVKRKIECQRGLLLHIREQRSDLRLQMTSASQVLDNILEELETPDIEMESLRGFEGGASAAYFGAYTKAFPESLDFSGRNRRPPQDPVNAVLSLCYTLLHFDVVREIEVIGLDPGIGFYHQFDYGRESLACDLVEPYRPMVDKFVWEIFRERSFTARDFAMNDERPGCYLKKESRKRFYPMYEEWVQNTRSQWIEEVRELARRIMDGQDIIHKSEQ